MMLFASDNLGHDSEGFFIQVCVCYVLAGII